MVMLHFVLVARPPEGGEFAAGSMSTNDIVGRQGASTVFLRNAHPAIPADTVAF